MKNLSILVRDGFLFILRFIRDCLEFILSIIGHSLPQLAGLIIIPAVFIFEVATGKRFRRPAGMNSPGHFPYTELAEGFSDSGSTVLFICGAKPLDATIFVYADFYPHHGKKTFLPQTRFFFALNRGKSYEIQIPWQLFQGPKLWSVSRLDIQVGNDLLFGGTVRTPDVMRLASPCLEFLFESASESVANKHAINSLGRVLLSCTESAKRGRPFLACTYQADKGPIICLARSETEKNAQIDLDITIQRLFQP